MPLDLKSFDGQRGVVFTFIYSMESSSEQGKVHWKCEACDYRFSTLIEMDKVDEMDRQPDPPLCPSCGEDWVWFVGSEVLEDGPNGRSTASGMLL